MNEGFQNFESLIFFNEKRFNDLKIPTENLFIYIN